MVATAESVKRMIALAFADVSYPGDARIAKCSRPECDECAGIRWGLRGRSPGLMFPYVLEYHAGALPLLFPEAFHYFIPSYMSFAVEHPDSEVADFTLLSIAQAKVDDFWNERFGLLTPSQREAVIAFLEFMKAQEIAGDEEDNANCRKRIEAGIESWKTMADQSVAQ